MPSLFLFFLLFVPSTLIMAAPFCIEDKGLSQECYYYDVNQCRKEASKISGYCAINREEVAMTKGNGSFCLVDSSLIPQCYYEEAQVCEEEAIRRGAVCFENIKKERSDAFREERDSFRHKTER